MLTAVPNGLNKASRIVVLRHPNKQDATCYRKTVNRTAPETVGGMPTMGGMGVLDSEDEADFTYNEVGDVAVLFCGQYQAAMGNMVDADDGLNYADGIIEALIECVLDPGAAGYFTPDKNDVVMVMPGGGFVVPYEIVGVTGQVNIPPYTRRYLLQPRQDFQTGI